MKKIMFGILTVFFFMMSCNNNSESLKGQVLFGEKWTAIPKFENESSSYFWVIPIKVNNDTIYVNYYYTEVGIRDLVATKALYELGYSIEDRYKIVYLSKDSIPSILYIDNR